VKYWGLFESGDRPGQVSLTTFVMGTLSLLFGASLVYWAYFYVSRLRHSISEAKRSGFNYVVVRKFTLAVESTC